MSGLVELCLESAHDVRRAFQLGAKRVELCRDRGCGGLTPEPNVLDEACQNGQGQVQVLIRPRAGDFLFNANDRSRITRDIDRARNAGASGVVIGSLCPDRRVDREVVGEWIARARPLSVTFHKAFDETPDPLEALDSLIELGCDRVLTSGQAVNASKGLAVLGQLITAAQGRIKVMAGGGIRQADLPAIRSLGVEEVHVGSCILHQGQVDDTLIRKVIETWELLINQRRPGQN